MGGDYMSQKEKKPNRKRIDKNLYYDSIRKLYYVKLYYRTSEQGKQVVKWQTYKTKSEAIKALKLFEINKADNNVIEPHSITIEQFLEHWMNSIVKMKCEETTIYGYENIINNHIIPYLGECKISDITVSKILDYMAYLSSEKGLSNNTIRKHYDILKTALKQAVKEDKIATNVMDKVDPPKTEKKEMSYYTAEELVLLLDIIKDKPSLNIAVNIAAFTGLRREEIMGLTWDNINFEKSEMIIKTAITKAGSHEIIKKPKNDESYRKIHIPEELLRQLNELRSVQARNASLFGVPVEEYKYVFCKPDGNRYHVNYVSTMLKMVIEQYHLKPLRFHDIRHTFASIAHDQGVDIYDISKTLGHSNINTTSKIYTHLFDKSHREVIESVQDSIMNAKKKNK